MVGLGFKGFRVEGLGFLKPSLKPLTNMAHGVPLQPGRLWLAGGVGTLPASLAGKVLYGRGRALWVKYREHGVPYG